MSADPPSLLRHHLEDLRRSGLSDETIRLARVSSERDPERLSRLLGWEHPAASLGPCLVFPFVDLAGGPTAYARLKPDRPRIVDGKPAKYESPLGQPNRVYFPPAARAVIEDTSVPLLITEGEKKSLCADQHGHACVSLVGVWGWVKKREHDGDARELHPDLKEFAFKGRRVYVVFDSDAASNDHIRYSEWELGSLLLGLGADVRIVRLPATLGGPKVGLDDLLVTAGPDAFAEALRAASTPVQPPVGFSNTAKRPGADGKAVNVPRSAAEMAAELVGKSGGWPRNVGGCLVAPDRAGGVRPLAKCHQLFAYIGSVFSTGSENRLTWAKGPSCVPREEFHEYLTAECERFDRADPLPHVPPIPGVLYTAPTPQPDGKYQALGEFLSFFNPATEEDASLLVACLLTPLWGGPPGKRPAFLFEAAEDDEHGGRGVGKTTIAQKVAAVYGGAFDIDASETFARTRSRLLTPDAGSYRVLLMDNVKTFRLSSADLESLVTSPHVNGHRLYHGQAGVPNYFTLFITLNGASLSKDFAQRVIPLRFSRARYRPGWDAEIDAFLRTHRRRLIGDLVGALRRPAADLARLSRWGSWESEVLARVEYPDRCMRVIDERTVNMDADREDADRITETFAGIVSRNFAGIAVRSRFLLTSAAVTRLVELALNNRFSAAAAKAQIRALGVPQLRDSNRNGRRLMLWTGSAYKPSPAPETPRVVDYDPEKESWSVGSLREPEDEPVLG